MKSSSSMAREIVKQAHSYQLLCLAVETDFATQKIIYVFTFCDIWGASWCSLFYYTTTIRLFDISFRLFLFKFSIKFAFKILFCVAFPNSKFFLCSHTKLLCYFTEGGNSICKLVCLGWRRNCQQKSAGKPHLIRKKVSRFHLHERIFDTRN